MSHTEPHDDEFLELCALSTSGELTEAERKRLDAHLGSCLLCQEALQQYETLVSDVIPAVAASEMLSATSEGPKAGPGWSEKRAEALLERIAHEERSGKNGQRAVQEGPLAEARPIRFASSVTWRQVWTLYAAGILLAIALGISLYQVGIHHGVESARRVSPPTLVPPSETSLEAQLSDVAHAREVARAEVAERDREIRELRRQMARQSADLARMKIARDQLATDLDSRNASSQDLLRQQAEWKHRVDAAQDREQALQQKLDLLVHESSEAQTRVGQLTAQVKDLTQALGKRDAALAEKDEMLAKDRDIRELMGARDLHVAEVYDVARTGETQKPYGRVFFTKGKSLIFYAYDLDQEPEVKSARTFQVWGRRGPDREQALSLGIFYVDNASKKRWVMKLDDPQRLAQIDAVFVTMEPTGGSHKPSGKPLLFAYLKTDPNHP